MNATIYTIPNCTKCSAAKALMRRKGIEFKEIDVIAEKDANQWAHEVNYAFPITMIDGKKIEGFIKLKEELK